MRSKYCSGNAHTPTHTSTRTLAHTPHTHTHTHTNTPHNISKSTQGTRRTQRPTELKTTHHTHKTQRTEPRNESTDKTHKAHRGPNAHTHTHHITTRGHRTNFVGTLISRAQSFGSKSARFCASAADIKATLRGQCRPPEQTRCNPPVRVFDQRHQGC